MLLEYRQQSFQYYYASPVAVAAAAAADTAVIVVAAVVVVVDTKEKKLEDGVVDGDRLREEEGRKDTPPLPEGLVDDKDYYW